MKGYREQGFARLLFYCKQPVNFTTVQKGNRLSVQFDRSFAINFGTLQKDLAGYISGAAESGDGKTVILFLVDENIHLRKFLGETFVGVDLLSANEPATPQTTQTPATPPTTKQPTSSKSLASSLSLRPEVSSDIPKKVEVPWSTDELEKTKPPKFVFNAEKDLVLTAKLLFPWKEKVSIAAFARNHTLWIVFDAFRPIDLHQFIEAHPDTISRGDQLNNRHYTILRLNMTKTLYPKVEQHGFDWEVNLYEHSPSPAQPIQVTQEFRSPPGPYVQLRAFPEHDPLRIVDPEIGDELLVMPLATNGSGIRNGKQYVDFALLQTAQGIAVQLIADNVDIRYLGKGVEITSPSLDLFRESQLDTPLPDSVANRDAFAAKLALEKQKEAERRAASKSDKAGTLFPLDIWKRGGNASFTSNLFMLQDHIFNAAVSQRSDGRLALAQFYLAHNMPAEALGVLRYMQYVDPIFSQKEEVRRVKALALFLQGYYSQALETFATLTASNQPEKEEIAFWKQAVNFKTLYDTTPIPSYYFHYRNAFLTRYPVWLRQKLLLAEMDYHTQSQAYSTLKSLLPLVKGLDNNPHFHNDITYYQGVVAANTGKEDNAKKLWQPLTQDVFDPHNRARAEFALMELEFSEGNLTKEQTIDRLNKIRMIWRGDDLELNTLKILGQLYIDNKQYREGLRVWKEIVTYFPQTTDALFIAKKMLQTFVYLFNQGGADNLTPLQALALYYEFKEWTPIGKQGEIMIQNLANRLFQADLLDQAAALLTHQVQFRLEGEEKVRIGSKLALIHLLNKKPSLALDVLDTIEAKDLPNIYAKKRLHLRAQALVDLAQYPKALKLLHTDTSLDANLIRQDIYWRTQAWDGLISMLAPYISLLSDTHGQLTPAQSDALLRLTVAYSLTNNTPALEKLYQTFHGRIPNEQNHVKIFDFLAGSLMPINHKDFDSTVQLNDFETFLKKYDKETRQEGLSPPPSDGNI